MSPEDDVNKDSESETVEKDANDATSETVAEEETQNAIDAESQGDESAQGLEDQPAADGETDQEEAVDAEATSDDPLGFGSARMDASEAGSDSDESVEGEPSEPEAKLQESEARVATLQDQMLRLQAEMENQRKRAQNDVTKAHKFALEKIALDLLPVKDSLEMGIQAASGEDAELGKIVEGSELTLKMFSQVLEKYNIVEVNPMDEKFDPEFHQAMSMQPVEGKEPNTVASVMQKGYTLNDRLIRAALVMVAK